MSVFLFFIFSIKMADPEIQNTHSSVPYKRLGTTVTFPRRENSPKAMFLFQNENDNCPFSTEDSGLVSGTR